jgi:hypothetical protein
MIVLERFVGFQGKISSCFGMIGKGQKTSVHAILSFICASYGKQFLSTEFGGALNIAD